MGAILLDCEVMRYASMPADTPSIHLKRPHKTTPQRPTRGEAIGIHCAAVQWEMAVRYRKDISYIAWGLRDPLYGALRGRIMGFPRRVTLERPIAGISNRLAPDSRNIAASQRTAASGLNGHKIVPAASWPRAWSASEPAEWPPALAPS